MKMTGSHSIKFGKCVAVKTRLVLTMGVTLEVGTCYNKIVSFVFGLPFVIGPGRMTLSHGVRYKD